MITLSNSTTHRNRIERGEPVGPPAGPENKGQRAQRAAANGARDRKRRREEKGGADAYQYPQPAPPPKGLHHIVRT